MTLEEVKFAMHNMHNRLPVYITRGSVEIYKPLEVGGIAQMIRTDFEVERGKERYYINVILYGSGRRSVINAGADQLDPAEPERFAAMLAEYNEIMARRKRGESGA